MAKSEDDYSDYADSYVSDYDDASSDYSDDQSALDVDDDGSDTDNEEDEEEEYLGGNDDADENNQVIDGTLEIDNDTDIIEGNLDNDDIYVPQVDGPEPDDADDVFDNNDLFDEDTQLNEGDDDAYTTTNSIIKTSELNAKDDDDLSSVTGKSSQVIDTSKCIYSNIKKPISHVRSTHKPTNIPKKGVFIPPTKTKDADRISQPILTYNEMVDVIGSRISHLERGSKPLINGIEGLTIPQIAYLELRFKMTPFIIRRHMPNRKYEDWKIDELEQIHVIEDPMYNPSSQQDGL